MQLPCQRSQQTVSTCCVWEGEGGRECWCSTNFIQSFNLTDLQTTCTYMFVREMQEVAWVCWVEPLHWFYICETLVNVVVMVAVYMYKLSNRCGCLFVRWLLCRWCWRGLVMSRVLRNNNQIDWFSYSGYMRGLWRSSWTIEKFSWLQWSKLCVCVCVCVSLS